MEVRVELAKEIRDLRRETVVGRSEEEVGSGTGIGLGLGLGLEQGGKGDQKAVEGKREPIGGRGGGVVYFIHSQVPLCS